MVVYVALVVDTCDVSTMFRAPQTLEEVQLLAEQFMKQAKTNFTFQFTGLHSNDPVIVDS
jgi:hypothetical protein